MVRGVKKLVNSSDLLCINGIGGSNSSTNSSTTLLNSSGEWARFAGTSGSCRKGCSLFRGTGAEKLFSRTIVEALGKFPVRPWEERGKPVDEQWLAKQLRPYGIQPRMMWIDGHGERADMWRGLRRSSARQSQGTIMLFVSPSLKVYGSLSTPTDSTCPSMCTV